MVQGAGWLLRAQSQLHREPEQQTLPRDPAPNRLELCTAPSHRSLTYSIILTLPPKSPPDPAAERMNPFSSLPLHCAPLAPQNFLRLSVDSWISMPGPPGQVIIPRAHTRSTEPIPREPRHRTLTAPANPTNKTLRIPTLPFRIPHEFPPKQRGVGAGADPPEGLRGPRGRAGLLRGRPHTRPRRPAPLTSPGSGSCLTSAL